MSTTPATSSAHDQLARAQEDYDALRAKGLSLDLTRGKPSPEQLDLSTPLVDMPLGDPHSEDGTDVRNYGGAQGLVELRRIFAPALGVPAEQMIAAGNSSLELMHATLTTLMMRGAAGSAQPWPVPGTSVLCPVPGYDRHFALSEHYGLRLIPVPMTGHGPDMDVVESLASQDSSVRGMWCVPQYSNPSGETYSDDTVSRLAHMRTAAPDFRVFWDNAYAVHDLRGGGDRVASLVEACAEAGNPERPIMFASSSKITLAGAGVAFVAGSPDTVAWWLKEASIRTIGPDKVNQLRHARFFGDSEGLYKHMAAHADIITPKFRAVDEALSAQLAGKELASWSTPRGGYFVSLDVPEGCAARVVELAADAGIKLTPAGATHPGGKDPADRTIRLAPSMPSVDDVRVAMDGVGICVRLAGYSQRAGENAAF